MELAVFMLSDMKCALFYTFHGVVSVLEHPNEATAWPGVRDMVSASSFMIITRRSLRQPKIRAGCTKYIIMA